MKRSRRSPFSLSRKISQVDTDSKVEAAQGWLETMVPQTLSSSTFIELPANRRNLLGLIVSISLIFVFFAWQLFGIQVVRGEQYQGLARGNRIRDEISYAPRGNIYDRNGVLLAENSPSFQLVAVPYSMAEDPEERATDLRQVASLTGQKFSNLQSEFEPHSDDYPLPIVLKSKLTHRDALRIEQKLPELQGFQLNIIPLRQYVDVANLAHALGYVGRVSEDDIEKRDDLLPTDFVGRAGIEAQYDKILRGKNGGQRTEVDALGRPVRILANDPAEQGNDIRLTIDYKLQKQLAQGLKKQIKASDSKKGVALAINPKNGEVLAMVSIPSYDNNQFAGGISARDYQRLINDPKQPLYNRAVSGAYSVGSTIKPVIASAALQEKVVTPSTTIVDKGKLTLVNRYNPSDSITFKNFASQAHGRINIEDAIAKSSNVFFFTVGGGFGNIKGLGIERLNSYYRDFGFGTPTGIDLPEEISGTVPGAAWNEAHLGRGWFTGDTYNVSIGQGNLAITPMQLAMAHSAVFNRGQLLKPRLLESVDGEAVENAPESLRRVQVDQKHLNTVISGMRQGATSGTASGVDWSGVPRVATKTGTAETALGDKGNPHIWMSATAPFDNPQILIIAMVEESRLSSPTMGNVIAPAMRQYFSNQ